MNRHSVTIAAVLVILLICGLQYQLVFGGGSGDGLLSALLSGGWLVAFIVARISAGFLPNALLLLRRLAFTL